MKAAPAQPIPANERGFILIEVLISALVITIVAGAVLALIGASTRSAASQRAHAVAYGLAQEDQARLRTMRISSLERLNSKREETLDGSTFQIVSQGTYVNSTTGTESCVEGSSSADYVKITSTVSSQVLLKPVVLQSIVSPSSNAVDAQHGTLSFGAKNASGQALSGVSISGTGPSSFSGSTDETGCANFADLPAGNYNVTTSAAGMINPQGETSTTKVIGVASHGSQVISLLYDKPGAVEPEFVYLNSSGVLTPASADSMELFDAESGSTAKTYGTPAGTRTTTLLATNLFPFKTKYTIYAGSCETNNPDPEEKLPGNRAAMAFVSVPPGESLKPHPVIQLPTLNLKVTYNGVAQKEAVVTATDTKCKYNGSFVKRTYTTNAEGKQVSATSGLELGKRPVEPGLPWGKYNLCASLKLTSSEYRKVEASSVAVENLTTTGTPVELNLSGSSSVKSSSSC